ncbi:B3/4 domain-containing protein [Paracoccus yeei]|uniref:B3/B4 domain-containing protein n=1 Tax=Paracoccus yeei TaxID=147645 RepID=UPI003BF7FBD2
MTFVPRIAPEIFALRPDFTALSIHVTNGRNGPSDSESAARLEAACADLGATDWAEEHLGAWRDAYRGFGAKPKKTPCSAEALRKRAEKDGGMPPLNAVVDIYNALSIRYAVPVGGEDVSGYVSPPRLWRAVGTEGFDTTASGQPAVETVEAGEVVWGDDAGVTCRRWNWRQGTRTRITEASTEMWFVLERLNPMPVITLIEAAAELIADLTRLSPALKATTLLFDAEGARPPS